MAGRSHDIGSVLVLYAIRRHCERRSRPSAPHLTLEIPWLAGIDPDAGAPRLRVAKLTKIPAETRPLIELLVEQRLLATDTDKVTGYKTIEPAHEALLRQWGVLEGWLAEDFEDLAILEGIKRTARDWNAHARDKEWLAHNGGRLEAAEKVAARRDFHGLLTADERAYLMAARQLNDAQEQAEIARLKRERRLSRGITFGALAAAALMAWLGWIMYGQWQEGLRSESLLLADLALQHTNNRNPTIGLLLALEVLPDQEATEVTRRVRPYVPRAEFARHSARHSPGLELFRFGLEQHFITSAEVSPNGLHVLTESRDSRRDGSGAGEHLAILWDISTGQAVWRLKK